MKNKCIILTGGGTAGHVTLNINLQEELFKHFEKVVYIGSKNGIEKKLITENTKYEYKEITTTKLSRKKLFKNLSIPFKLLKAIKQVKQIIKECEPCIIFSKGGYVGLPVTIAGKKMNVPVVCHESDLTMGLANKMAKKYATKICTNFKKTAEKNGSSSVHTGMPLPTCNLTKEQAKQKLKISTTKPILLICGGSLGAKAINDFVWKNIDKLTKEYFVLHLTGKNNLNKKINNKSYKQIEFSNNMPVIYKSADYAISRAGANTIFELLSNKILTIFIPLPKSVSRGDQIENSKYLESIGCSKTIFQEKLNIEKVQNFLNLIKKDANIIKNNINNADFVDGTKNIINVILQEKKN